MSLSPSIEWLAASVRVSFFCAKPVGSAGGVFEELTGRKPEAIHQQPQLGQSMEVGSAGAGPGQLLVQSAVNRIDFIVQGFPSIDVASLPSVGHPVAAIQDLSKLVGAWVLQQGQLEVNRVAVGSAAFAQCADLSQASKLAMSVLPKMDIDVGRVEDLSVQFNFPTTSLAVKNLKINRLTKIGAVGFETLRVSPMDSQPPSFVRGFAAQYELDLSTDAARTDAFALGAVGDLVSELTAFVERAYSGALLVEEGV